MKKRIGWLAMAVALSGFALYSESYGWKIDETLKYQIVYLPSDTRPMSTVPGDSIQVMKPLLKNIPAFKPDIGNIVYKNICGLGFSLPVRENASSLKLYLKIYAWPATLDPVRSSYKIFNDFLLYALPGGERLYASAKNRANTFVKYASIDSADREFSLKKSFEAPEVPSQWEFDCHTPFSSIYVKPNNESHKKSEIAQAKASAGGVIEFHAAISDLYEKSLRLLQVANGKKYFADFRLCPEKPEKICVVRIYEIPIEPLVFSNYRDLPMPQDADKIFLSGLLLVKLTDYAAVLPFPLKEMTNVYPGTKTFESGFHALWSHMLEVGSVLDMR